MNRVTDSKESIHDLYQDHLDENFIMKDKNDMTKYEVDNVKYVVDPYREYLNLLTENTDANNKAYESLLNKDESVKELIHIGDIFDFEEDNDEIGDDNDPLFNGTLKSQEVSLNFNPKLGENKISGDMSTYLQGENDPTKPSCIPSQIYGSPDLQRRLRDVCYTYSDVFSRFVKANAADVSPMELEVDREEWERPMNRLPARPQSTPNQEEIRRQLHKMLDLGVISPSKSTHWSQVLLAAKSNGSKRFCIDLRALNKDLRDQGWQIPNIAQMINRIGAMNMKFFGTMDLTSGYHQMPMDPRSSWMTAFITFMGVYQWNKVPMGVKPAANFFQKTMAIDVL
jgi:hypothetical protein